MDNVINKTVRKCPIIAMLQTEYLHVWGLLK